MSEPSGYMVEEDDQGRNGRVDVTLSFTGGSIPEGAPIDVVILEQFNDLRISVTGYEAMR